MNNLQVNTGPDGTEVVDIAHGEDEVIRTNTSNSRRRQRPNRSRAAIGKKVDYILRILRKKSISLQTFLQYFLEDTQYSRLASLYRPHVLSKIASSKQLKDQFISNILDEFDQLLGQKYFQTFDQDTSLDEVDFAAAYDSIQAIAPTWHTLVTALMKNTRAYRASYQKHVPSQGKPHLKYLFTVTSIISHCRSKQNSNFFTRNVGIYLQGLGIQRRALETLSGLGICSSYAETLGLLHRIRDRERV